MSMRVQSNPSVARTQEAGQPNVVKQIQQANPKLTHPDLISAGDTLKLPGVSTPGGDSFVPDPSAPAAPVTPGGKVDASKVPFISQYNPSGKDGRYTNGSANCGPASMAMIARAFGYGQDMTDARLINHLGRAGGTSGDGTSVNGILAMAQAMGKKGEMKGPGADTSWIADQLKQGRKVVANLDYYATAGHQNDGKSSGHYVTVAGMDSNGNFIIRDPADQNVRTLTPRQLSYAISQNPNGGYQFAIG